MAGDLVRIEPRTASMDDLRAFAEAAVKSKFYGFESVDQMLPLMIIAQSEGRSFASAVQDYSVIQGRPALKAEAMLARFQKSGGHVRWTELSDTRCAAVFSHAQCDPVEVDWDMPRAAKAGLGNREMWKKYPRNMLKARVISDGVRTAYPACLGGLYTPEEVGDMEIAAPTSRAALPPADAEVQVEPGATAGAAIEHSERVAAPAPSNTQGRSIAKQTYADVKNGDEPGLEIGSKDSERLAAAKKHPLWATLKTAMREHGDRISAETWLRDQKYCETDFARQPPKWRSLFYTTEFLPYVANLPEMVGS
jgi:hypothetical protein